jgi:hypothetical protein
MVVIDVGFKRSHRILIDPLWRLPGFRGEQQRILSKGIDI